MYSGIMLSGFWARTSPILLIEQEKMFLLAIPRPFIHYLPIRGTLSPSKHCILGSNTTFIHQSKYSLFISFQSFCLPYHIIINVLIPRLRQGLCRIKPNNIYIYFSFRLLFSAFRAKLAHYCAHNFMAKLFSFISKNVPRNPF